MMGSRSQLARRGCVSRQSPEDPPLSDPRVSFVVIGLDEAENLASSIASLSSQGIERAHIEVLYVDSGSRDGSVAVARAAGADRVLSIPRSEANAARARNLGLENARAPFVHFVDGDTRLEDGWARIGLDALESDSTLVGVEGTLREARPIASFYDAVCELDWAVPAGLVDFVGGNALYRVEPLREVGGFDPEMRAGEEPELGTRLRVRGSQLRHLDSIMAWHHLGIRSFRDYLRRNYTTGVACALVVQKTGGLRRGYWSGRLWRTLGHAAMLMTPVTLAIPLAAVALGPGIALACVGPAWLVSMAARKTRAKRNQGVDRRLAMAFGLHSYIAKIHAAAGILAVIAREARSAHRTRGKSSGGRENVEI